MPKLKQIINENEVKKHGVRLILKGAKNASFSVRYIRYLMI